MLALEKVLADLAQGRCTGTVDLRPKACLRMSVHAPCFVDSDDVTAENGPSEVGGVW